MVGYAFTANPTVSRTAHISLLGTNVAVTQAGLFTATLAASALEVASEAGTGTMALSVSAPLGPWTAAADDPWLHLDDSNRSGAGSATVVFTFDANDIRPRTGTLTIAGQKLTVSQSGAAARLGTATLLEGPAAGADSVVLSAVGGWTATANDPWLHLDASNAGGAGSTNVLFTFDANPDATRTGTLTIAGRTLAVMQAGATYVPAGPIDLPEAGGVGGEPIAVDRAGNVYFQGSDPEGQPGIRQWSAATGSVTTIVPGVTVNECLAADGGGNLYFVGDNYSSIRKWTESDGSLTTLLSGLESVFPLAADGAGNVYFGERPVFGSGPDLKKWNVRDGTVATLLSSREVGRVLYALAVDSAGTVYLVYLLDYGCSVGGDCPLDHVGRLTANLRIKRLVSLELFKSAYMGLAVDGAGAVYYAEYYPFAEGEIKKVTTNGKDYSYWDEYTGETLVSLNRGDAMGSLAADGVGNVYWSYYSDYRDGVFTSGGIRVLPRAFVDSTSASHEALAGSGSVPVVLPAGGSPRSPFTPTSDQPWLSAGSILNGAAEYSFTANTTGAPRTARLTVLGVPVTITQAAGPEPVLTGPVRLVNGDLQWGFAGDPARSYSVVFSSTVEREFSAWLPLGPATATSPGQFQFTVAPSPGSPMGFYRVRSR